LLLIVLPSMLRIISRKGVNVGIKEA